MATLLIYVSVVAVGAAILSVLIWNVVPGSRVRRQYLIASVLLVAVLCSGCLMQAIPVNA